MRTLGRILLGLVAIVVLLLVSQLLPRTVELERTVVVAAPPEKVFPMVNSLRQFATWSPWHQIDPAMTQTFTGPETGVGNRMAWESGLPDVGNGAQEITASTANERVETEIDFGGQGKATSWWQLAPEGAGTRVTWGFRTDLGVNPVARYMGLMFPDWIGADYDRGLANLKAKAEAP